MLDLDSLRSSPDVRDTVEETCHRLDRAVHGGIAHWGAHRFRGRLPGVVHVKDVLTGRIQVVVGGQHLLAEECQGLTRVGGAPSWQVDGVQLSLLLL